MPDFSQPVRGTVFDADGVVVDRIDDQGNICRTQDVTEILRANHAERMEDRFQGFRIAPNFRRVASIPVAAVDIAAAQGIDLLNDPAALRQFLNDPDNRAFRTTLERV